MYRNKRSILAVLAMIMTVGSLSACQDADSGGSSGGGLNQNFHSRQQDGSGGQGGDAISGSALDDGVLHVWPQSIADRVFFETDKSSIKPEGQDVLGKWVSFLNSHPRDQLLIEGHSDEHGTREYNLALGERRANAIKEFLVASGIQAERIKTVSYGKEMPAIIGSNEAAWSQNRRGVGVLQ